jgi:hypothetical protein
MFMRVIYGAIPISSRRSIATFLHGDALLTEAPDPGSAVTHLPNTFRQFEYFVPTLSIKYMRTPSDAPISEPCWEFLPYLLQVSVT